MSAFSDFMDSEDGIALLQEEQRATRQRTLGELFGAKPATPERLGLTLEDWDFPDPEAADWVTQDGRLCTLGGMTNAHLVNTFLYLGRRHGEAYLRRTPLGRAMMAVLAKRGDRGAVVTGGGQPLTGGSVFVQAAEPSRSVLRPGDYWGKPLEHGGYAFKRRTEDGWESLS